MISQADIYLGRAFSTRAYTYWKYAYELMSLGVALSKEETYRKFSRFNNSSIFTKLSKSRAKRDLRDRVAEKMGEKLHASKKVVKEQFPYMEIMFQNEDTAYEIATYFDLKDDEVKLFRSRKIKVKKSKPKPKQELDQPEGLNGVKAVTKKSKKKQVKKSVKETEDKTKKPRRNKKTVEESKIENKKDKKNPEKDAKDPQKSLFNF